MTNIANKSVIILIGAKPTSDTNQNPGGQMTASLGLIKYANSVGITLKVIDTTQSSFPVPSFSTRFKKGILRLGELLSLNRNYDIRGAIIFSSSGFSFYERILLAFLCKMLGIKTLLFIRSGHFMEELKASKFRLRLAKLFLRVPTLIGAQGENWREFYETLNVANQRIKVIRNWLSPDMKLLGIKSVTKKPVRFIFVGWVVKNKGVIELLNACELLTKQGYEFKLTIVGDGDLSSYVKDFVTHRNLSNSVQWVGWKSPQEVHFLLQKHDVFVLPTKAEGFPNSMLEAMSAGLPLIVSDVGDVSDSLLNNENGFLLASASASDIFNAMSKYIKDPSIIEKHSEMSLCILKKNHDHEQNCKKIFSLFES